MTQSPPTATAPDDVVAEVAGDPYTPLEMGSAIALGVVSLLIAGLLPLLLSALAEEHRLSASGIGIAAMIEALSTGLVAGLAAIVLKPRRLRGIAVAAVILLALLDLATVRTSGGSVFLVRALAGVPEGLMLWIAIGLISRTQTPERWAAVLFTGMGLTQVAAATGLSAYILPRFGANGAYLALAAASLLGLPLAALLPRALGVVPGSEGSAGGSPPLRGWIALGATLAFAAALAAVSVYVLPLARQAGLSVAVGRTAVSTALGCQIAGGALATVLAGRVRYIAIFWIVTTALLAIWIVYALHAPAALFVAMTGVSGLCTGLAGPFLVPMTVEADPTRRAAMQSGAVQLLAGALGPLLAAMVVGERDAHGVLLLGAALSLTGLAVATVLHRIAHAERRTAAAPSS
jgi:hypothetical protein